MTKQQQFEDFINDPKHSIFPVVDFEKATDRLCTLDFTSSNTTLSNEILGSTETFSKWVNEQLLAGGCRYGIGGYDEHRTIYSRSAHFDTEEEPRRLHLGVDIWGPVGTHVYNFMDGEVHSFKNNDNFGDYGATIILKYKMGDLDVYALYGHLSLASIAGLSVGMPIAAGAAFATFGAPSENGNWPPHLHFQLIFDMYGKLGDYPGVCQFSKKSLWLNNGADPNKVLAYTFS
ncbi:MAG: peptidase M23 [Pedobacter sp.]|nr:MAG: peptidase M23 [Pedobacter sp.]